MLNYLKKFALEIMPSVAATVIGAYIVNHYVSRPAADAPVAAVAPAHSKKEAKAAHGGAEVVSNPGHGVKARGISERALMEKAAAEKPAEVKPIELKGAEAKPSETASIPVDSRHHTPASASREKTEKTMAKVAPPPAASPAAPVQTAAAPATAEEHRDANDLARAAIERLRNADSQRTQEASRAPEAPRLQEVPRTVIPLPATAAVHPLPPPIMVTVPPVEAPTATAAIPNDDPNRPIPPADIPPPPPVPSIDLKADANKLATRTTNMAQDMLHAARSMFHAVLPGSDRQDSSSASQFTD